MTRRFCDMCDKEMSTEDDLPFIRKLKFGNPQKMAIGFIMITNEFNHTISDICSDCKLAIVTQGLPHVIEGSTVATLQPMVPSDQEMPVMLYREPKPPDLPDKPPQLPPNPPVKFEPSLPR